MKYIQDFFLASSEPSSLCISNSQSASSVNNQLQLPSAVVNISTERAESRIKDIQAAVHMYVGGGKESQIYRLAGCARRDTNKLHIDVDFQNDKYLLDDQGKRTYTSFFNEFHKSDNGSIDRIIAQKKLQQQCPKGKKDLDIFVSSVLHTQLASAAPFAANNRSDMSINNRINLIEDVSRVPLSKIIHITNVSEKRKKLLM